MAKLLIANELNNYFCNIGQLLNAELPNSDACYTRFIAPPSRECTFEMLIKKETI